MNFVKRLLTWWNSQTIGTQFFTWRRGKRVGQDEQGNVFYQTKDGQRRWVIYNGSIEASRISPDWHGWLHHTFPTPPTEEPLPKKKWEQKHLPNQTGTASAYAPKGSLRLASKSIPPDYVPWTPR